MTVAAPEIADHGPGGLVPITVHSETRVGQKRYVLASPKVAPALELVYRVEGDRCVEIEDDDERAAAMSAFVLDVADDPQPMRLTLKDGVERAFWLHAELELEGRTYLLVLEQPRAPEALILRREADGSLTLVPDAAERERVRARYAALVAEKKKLRPSFEHAQMLGTAALLVEAEQLLAEVPEEARGTRDYKELARTVAALRERLAGSA